MKKQFCWKKGVAVALALVLAGMSVPVTGSVTSPVSMYAEEQSEDFIIRDGVLRAYLGYDEHVTIPDGVTAIGVNAFRSTGGMTSVTIPDTVTEIGDYAFYECTGLTEINIPKGVAVISDYAFGNCNNLTKVTISDGVTEMGERAFSFCANLTEISIPASVKTIGRNAFEGTKWLEQEKQTNKLVIVNSTLVGVGDDELGDVVIPEGVTEIATDFSNRNDLTSIVIPEGIVEIPSQSFFNCVCLQSICIPSTVIKINESAFMNCSRLEKLELPDGLRQIGSSAFYGCKSLGKMDLPQKLEGIGYSIFRNCANLSTVSFPQEVTSFAVGAFEGTSWLEQKRAENPLVVVNSVLVDGRTASGNIVVPDGITAIADGAFRECTGAGCIVLPESLTYIGSDAFKGCSSLTELTIPQQVKDIGERAFHGCTSLTHITIPDGVQKIEDETFRNCSLLAEIDIPESIQEVGDYCFAGSLWLEKRRAENPYVVISHTLIDAKMVSGDVVVPEGITKISGGVFRGNNNLTSVKLPGSLKVIGSNAFNYCVNLQSVEFQEGLEMIQNNAFAYCSNLKSVSLPESLKLINSPYIFRNCSSLEEVTIPKDTVIGLNGISILDRGSANLVIYGYAGSDAQILAKLRRYAFEEIKNDGAEPSESEEPQPSEEVSKVSDFTIVDGVVTGYKGTAPNVIIPDGVTAIGDRAFYGMDDMENYNSNSDKIRKVVIPEGVTTIGAEAFAFCTWLQSITLPDTLTNIGESAFSMCMNLESITIPSKVNQIENSTFTACVALKKVVLPDELKSIGAYAFNSCQALQTIILPEKLNTLEKGAFRACGLKDIELPPNIGNTLAEDLFIECTELESILIPACVKNLSYEYNFDKCTSLSVVRGYKGSMAEVFAKDNGFTFISLGDITTEDPSGSENPDSSTRPLESEEPQPSISEEPQPPVSEPPLPTENSKTEIITNPDGTTTEKKTENSVSEDGTRIETVTETTTGKDGSVTEKKEQTITNTDGSTETVKSEKVTNTDGSVREQMESLRKENDRLLSVIEKLLKYAEDIYNRYVKKEEKQEDGITIIKEVSESSVEIDGVIQKTAVIKDEKKDESGKSVERFEYDRNVLGEKVEWKTKHDKTVEDAFKEKIDARKPLGSASYEITPMEDGEQVQVSGGSVKVTLYYGEAKKSSSRFKVYDCERDAWLDAHFEDGYVQFDAPHFSKYIITEIEGTEKGDVDSGGTITLMDAQLTLKAALKISSLDEAQMNAADVNGDGR